MQQIAARQGRALYISVVVRTADNRVAMGSPGLGASTSHNRTGGGPVRPANASRRQQLRSRWEIVQSLQVVGPGVASPRLGRGEAFRLTAARNQASTTSSLSAVCLIFAGGNREIDVDAYSHFASMESHLRRISSDIAPVVLLPANGSKT